MGTGGALWNARDYLEDEFVLVWGDDYHPINYRRLFKAHTEHGLPITMTVIEGHDTFNLHHENGVVVEYSKEDVKSSYNGYEAGTSVVKKSVIDDIGKSGVWSWEESAYPAYSGRIHAHIDETPFWDMGTPERLSKLENYFQSRRTG